MKNFKLSRFLAAVTFVACLALTACAQSTSYVTPVPVEKKLAGTWVSTWSEKFVITDTSLSNSGSTYNGYAGDSLTIKELSSSSGTIFIKYTRAMLPNFTYSETAPDVGKWYAISYKDLTDKTVKFSGAYKASGKTSCASLDEAIAEFTVENGYFASYSDCTKQ